MFSFAVLPLKWNWAGPILLAARRADGRVRQSVSSRLRNSGPTVVCVSQFPQDLGTSAQDQRGSDIRPVFIIEAKTLLLQWTGVASSCAG